MGRMTMTESRPVILVVDDEAQIRKFLRISLTAHGYDVIEAPRGEDAVRKVATESPALVVLDLGLPDLDGREVIRRLREWSQVPILVLSVRAGETDKVDALDMGANDYVTKPFGIAELVARVRVLLRTRPGAGDEDEATFDVGGLYVDYASHRVRVDGEQVRLTRKEFAILRLLCRHAGKVLTHQTILNEVWGPNSTKESHYLRVHIGHLRQKLKDDPNAPRFIWTEPGVGYRLMAGD